ncbi:hypothetical protein HDU98_007387 [Podochytrium sp. JEL0797]|nr:hypothetical protein HDU98_007387 [Podochytrium sp. JEL0797]
MSASSTIRKNAPKKSVTGNAPGSSVRDVISESSTDLDDTTRSYNLRSYPSSTPTPTTSLAPTAAAPLSAQQ